MLFPPPLSISFETSVNLAAIAGNTAAVQIQNVSAVPQRQMGITRIGVTLTSAVTTALGLIVPVTEGTPNVTLVNLLASYQAATAVALVNTGWAVAPTYAGSPVYFRQEDLSATAYQNFEWTWPDNDPLVVGIASSVILRNLLAGATGTLRVSLRWKEFFRG